MPSKFNKNYIGLLTVTVLAGLSVFSWSIQAEESANGLDAVSGQQQTKQEDVVEEKFDVFEYQIEGNTKLSNVEIETAVYPFLGEKRTFTDVRNAREALEKAYHQLGYLTVLVDIPEQEVANKVVKLSVTESTIGKLRIKDSDYYSLGRIKTLAKSVKEGEVPNFNDIQEDITKLNRTADRRVTPVMRAGEKYGTVDVDLKVEDKPPLHGSLEINDRYNQGTPRWRLGGNLSYDNLFDRDHSLSLSFLVSPEDNADSVKVLSSNYLMRFDETDALLAIYGVISRSEISTIGGINVLGDGEILGARYIKPLPSLSNYYHSLSVGVDYKNFGQSIVVGDVNGGTINQPIKYAPFSASYTGTWQGQSSTTNLTLGTIFGLRDFLASEGDFDARRSGAKPNFFIVNSEVNHTHYFENGFEAYGKVNTQFTDSRLVNNEQYLAGGVDSVRGYLETESAGDQGMNTRFEIRTPRLFKSVDWLNEFKLLAFHDFAYLHTNDAQAGEEKNQKIEGTGFGLNLKAFNHWNLRWYTGWALRNSLVKDAGDYQSHIRVWYDF